MVRGGGRGQEAEGRRQRAEGRRQKAGGSTVFSSGVRLFINAAVEEGTIGADQTNVRQ
jgi:hypothetical protein